MITMVGGDIGVLDYGEIADLVVLGYTEAQKPDVRVSADKSELSTVCEIMFKLQAISGTPTPKKDTPRLVILPLADAVLALLRDMEMNCKQTPKIVAIRQNLALAAKFLDVFSMGFVLGQSSENDVPVPSQPAFSDN